MRQRTCPAVVTLASAMMLIVASAEAKINKERGNIVSTDWRNMEIQIQHAPSGNVGTWKVRRDARVRFSDKKDEFPNPTLSDLRAPMYIHYMFEEGTNLIQDIEVVEVGYEPSQGGPGVTQEALITNLDADKGHIEVDLGPGPQTFQVEPKEQLEDLRRGQKVTLLLEARDNGQEVVTFIKPHPEKESVLVRPGRITNLDANVGHVEVDMGAGRQTFRVEPKEQLHAFRRGQRVELRIETRDSGEQVVTRITRIR